MKHLHKFTEFLNESQQLTPEIEKFCKDTDITFDQYTGKTPIEGNLCITGTSIPHWDASSPWKTVELASPPPGFSPHIKGFLYLYGFDSLPDGFSPEVGGYLAIDGTPSLPSGFSPKVAHILSLSGISELPKNTEWITNIRGDILIKQVGKREVVLSHIMKTPIEWIKIK